MAYDKSPVARQRSLGVASRPDRQFEWIVGWSPTAGEEETRESCKHRTCLAGHSYFFLLALLDVFTTSVLAALAVTVDPRVRKPLTKMSEKVAAIFA